MRAGEQDRDSISPRRPADTAPGGAGVEDSATIDLADQAGMTGVEHPGF